MFIYNEPQIDMTQYYVTGHYIDHLECIAKCEFCTKEHLRYHFEIKHNTEDKILMVGSSCILQFGATVFAENGDVIIELTEKSKRLNFIMRQYEIKMCKDILRDIVKNDHTFGYLRCEYLDKLYLTPKQALRVFNRLYTNKVIYDPKWFTINMRKKSYKCEYGNMNKWEQSIVNTGLTIQQIKATATRI